MGRPYGKGHKRKKTGERYDKEEDEVEDKQVLEENTEEEREELPELEGIPIAPSTQTLKKPGVIFVLEKASLEVAKVGKV